MPTSWTFSIDWDRNGDFSGADDNVTPYVLQTNWFLGFRKAYQEMADNPICVLQLYNHNRRFSPENASSPLFGKIKPLRPVQVKSNDGTTERIHFVGWLEEIQPSPGQHGDRVIRFLATGAMQFLINAETKLELQQNKRTDEILDLLMKEVIIPPALTRALFLDVPGSNKLDVTAYLGGGSDEYADFDKGIQHLTVAGDNWVNDGGYADKPKDTFDVYRAMKDIVAAERGKFFFSRDGKAVFWNRWHLLDWYTVAATLDNTMTDLSYAFAGTDRFKNEIIITCHPRTISTETTDILWQLPADSVVRVDPGKSRDIYVKYEDDTTKKRVGAKDVTVTDVVMEQGSATATIEAQANGANLTFTNSGTQTAYVTACKVRGRKILDEGQMEAKRIDGLSIANHGRRTLRMNLASIDKLDDAEQIAEFEKQRRSNPVGEVQSVTLKSHALNPDTMTAAVQTLHAQQLARTMGHAVEIEETQTAHDGKYFIIGEAHEIQQAGKLWQTTWYLESVPVNRYFKLAQDNSPNPPTNGSELVADAATTGDVLGY